MAGPFLFAARFYGLNLGRSRSQVHTSGGMAALVMVILMGPRIGRFSDTGAPRKMERQSAIIQESIANMGRIVVSRRGTEGRARWYMFFCIS